jgi:hypothetical protein
MTSAPTGAVTLQAVEDVDLDVGTPPTASSVWSTIQGVLPAQLHLISLEGNIINGDASGGGRFITYPSANGTVDLLARGSITLNSGYVLSDANPDVLPTLNNIARCLSNPNISRS